MLRPWPFKDADLESKYQEYLKKSLIRRIRDFVVKVFIFSWILRMFLILTRLVFPYEWTYHEIALISLRIILSIAGLLSVTYEWDGQSNLMFASLMMWVVRIAFFAASAEQSGIQQMDSSLMYYPIMITVSGGLILPSFREFATYTTIMFLLKPTAIIVIGSKGCPKGIQDPCPGQDLQTVLVQNCCLICTAIGVFSQVHSDARRSWLLSFECFGLLNDVAPASATILLPSKAKSESGSMEPNIPGTIGRMTHMFHFRVNRFHLVPRTPATAASQATAQ